MSKKGVCYVVYEPYQFSWTIGEKPSVSDKGAWDLAAKAARLGSVIQSEALFYHNKTVQPKWAKAKTIVEIEGNHVFYK